MAALTGPGTAYLTPDLLRRAPTGIDWTTIPNNRSSPIEQQAEQANMCLRATSLINGAANQPLRATQDVEFFNGPDWLVTVQNQTGVGRVMCSRWPILQVISAKVSPAFQFPRQWTTIAASQLDIEKPPLGLFGASQAADAAEGGQAVLLAPGVINWWQGRNGWRIQIVYINGWPHTSITAAADEGATTISVDDCTGWAPSLYDPEDPGGGATGIVYDGMQQEVVNCVASSVTTGPGTLTLSSPLSWPHDAGTLVTTLPTSVINACIDLCSAMALERGATATTVQSMSGGGGGDGGPVTPDKLRQWAFDAVKTYARVI